MVTAVVATVLVVWPVPAPVPAPVFEVVGAAEVVVVVAGVKGVVFSAPVVALVV